MYPNFKYHKKAAGRRILAIHGAHRAMEWKLHGLMNSSDSQGPTPTHHRPNKTRRAAIIMMIKTIKMSRYQLKTGTTERPILCKILLKISQIFYNLSIYIYFLHVTPKSQYSFIMIISLNIHLPVHLVMDICCHCTSKFLHTKHFLSSIFKSSFSSPIAIAFIPS